MGSSDGQPPPKGLDTFEAALLLSARHVPAAPQTTVRDLELRILDRNSWRTKATAAVDFELWSVGGRGESPRLLGVFPASFIINLFRVHVDTLALLTHFQEKLDQRREEPRVLGPDMIQRAELRAARRRRAPLTSEGDSL